MSAPEDKVSTPTSAGIATQDSSDRGAAVAVAIPAQLVGDSPAKRKRFLGNLTTLSSFQAPAFRLFYASMLCQMAAMNMHMVVQSLLVYRITGSPTALGVVAVANAAPALVLGLFGGVLADRVPKKRIIIIGQSVSILMALVVGGALATGFLSPERPGSWWILVVTSMVQGASMGIVMPSRQTIISEIVKGPQLMNALALNNLGMNMLRFGAPAIAGFLIDAYGFKAVYFTMAVLFGFAAVLMVPLPRAVATAKASAGAIQDVKDGIRYIRSDTTIMLLLGITLLTVLLSMPYMNMLPVFTDTVLKVDATKLGLLMSVSGIGAMAGSLVLASLPNKRRGAMLLWGSLLLGVALVGFSFSVTYALALVAIVFVGIGQTMRMTLGNTLMQFYTKPEYRGRVMSIYFMEFGLTSFAVFFAGVMAEIVGVQWAVGGLAMLLILVAVLALVFSPRLRSLQ